MSIRDFVVVVYFNDGDDNGNIPFKTSLHIVLQLLNQSNSL
jgi:hypothetical protein